MRPPGIGTHLQEATKSNPEGFNRAFRKWPALPSYWRKKIPKNSLNEICQSYQEYARVFCFVFKSFELQKFVVHLLGKGGQFLKFTSFSPDTSFSYLLSSSSFSLCHFTFGHILSSPPPTPPAAWKRCVIYPARKGQTGKIQKTKGIYSLSISVSYPLSSGCPQICTSSLASVSREREWGGFEQR